jgi:diguanylate cyclase (GGDEF)-like protein
MGDRGDTPGMPEIETPRGAARLARAALERIASALRKPFQGVPSRIILSVFSAALVASLAVAWVSTQTIASFLRREIDESFPAVLERAGERLELWYSQRHLDLATFARSATVLEALDRLGRRESAGAARQELARYLAYVLESFPQYEALFLLDARGDTLLWAGDAHPLAPDLRGELAGTRRPRIGDFAPLGARLFQVVSAPVLDSHGEPVASLHALVGSEALAGVIAGDDPTQAGYLSIVARDGSYIVDGGARPPRQRYERRLPHAGEPPEVVDYQVAGGAYVVGSALRLPRFGWTIVVEEPYDAAFAPLVTVIRRIVALNLGIVGGFSVIAYLFARSIVRPILALSNSARRIADGETSVVIPETSGGGEIGVLIRVFNEMAAQLSTQYEQLHRANEVLEQLSITDGLTRLHNHRFFQDNLPREMRRAARSGEPLALVLIDVDDFKKLNDRFGHAVGDAVLRRAAEVMALLIRETDLLARYGGEEFALLASHTDRAGAVALAEKIRSSVGAARFPIVDHDGPVEVHITVSVGVAMFRGDEKAFFGDADRALYRAKAGGKDCVVVWDERAA